MGPGFSALSLIMVSAQIQRTSAHVIMLYCHIGIENSDAGKLSVELTKAIQADPEPLLVPQHHADLCWHRSRTAALGTQWRNGIDDGTDRVLNAIKLRKGRPPGSRDSLV
jgi:hypothetical protein